MDKTLKDLSLGSGDILVVQLGSVKYSTRDLSILQRRIHSIFDPVGVKILLIPEGITLSAVRFHKGNVAGPIQGLSGDHRPPDGDNNTDNIIIEYWNGTTWASTTKDLVPTEEKKNRQFRMIRADVKEEVITKLASLPPNKKATNLAR